MLLGENLDYDSYESYLLKHWQPTAYERWWSEKQKIDTKARSDRQIQETRSWEENTKVRLLDSHIVGSGRNQFNRVLVMGGNIGRRDLSKAFKDALALLKDRTSPRVSSWLRTTLLGTSEMPLPNLNSAGTWFVYANKTFNSGQSWYREGQISPWSFLLALEGALLLVGGVGRRLGSNAHHYAVFPFVTDAPSPTSDGEVGLARAEFWAPLWEHPANLAEVRALLQRGSARIGQRAAKAPHEFAVAALAAGVDAGIGTFVRFVLRQTTSGQVYEAIPRERITVRHTQDHTPDLIASLIPWLDRLPYEPRDSKQKGKFRGLRGPIEEAIVHVAEKPDEPEPWRRLLLRLAEVQGRIDHNQELRSRCRGLPFLDQAWFEKAWPSPLAEVLVARALASVGAGTEQPILVNIYGVEVDTRGAVRFPGDRRPQRAVWHTGSPLRVLAAVLERRLIDAKATDLLPLGGPCPCNAALVAAFLADTLDVEEIARWIPPLSLINWRRPHRRVVDTSGLLPSDGAFLLHALFRPLFHPSKISIEGDVLFPKPLQPRAVTVRRMLSLIRGQAWEEAVRLARDRYLAAGRATVALPPDFRVDGESLAAALLIPMYDSEVGAGLRRWLLPTRRVNP